MRLAAFLALPLLLAAAPGEDCRRAARRGQPAARACFERLALAQDAWSRAEGLWGLEMWNEAVKAFEEALRRDAKSPELRVRFGRLFLERFNQGEAAKLFQEALEAQEDYPPALLGMAHLMSENYDSRAVALTEKVLEKDPKNVEALELLARLHLENSDSKKAGETAGKALALEADAPDALAVKAAIEALADRPVSWKPGHAQGYVLVARMLVLNRRYDDAIGYYRKALELNPDWQPARSELGIQMMRVGDAAEAKRLLEEAYKAGYRNKATTNSLTLLDSYKRFHVHRTPRVVLMLQQMEADLLQPYVERETLRALDAYEKKYGLKLPGPVQVEMFPDHEDFAVRTMGMPGLGALGVTFNLSIAMDSPSGRKPGSFHWASTLWHELSHVFVLEATNHRVPRWFTEGVAVHEETAVNPEWGDRLTPDMLRAMKEKKLLPVNELDRGFVRPSYPQQVVVSYFQAGRIIDYVVGRWGWSKVLEMMRAFGARKTTAEVMAEVVGVPGEKFDNEFLAWLETQHRKPLEGFESWRKALPELHKALEAGRDEEVLTLAPPLLETYPDFVEEGSVYEVLASVYEKKGNPAALIAVLERYMRTGGRSPATLKKLASALEKAGRPADAAAALARINFIAPTNDEDLHRRLGGLYLSLKRWAPAVDEFRALVASRPVDMPGAHYQLALALKESGRLSEAQDQVMNALEAAPNYRPAQKLLLELTALGAGGEKKNE